jgi:hypothetical protein
LGSWAGHRREWLLDAQRDEDAFRMRLLCRRLLERRVGALEKENAAGQGPSAVVPSGKERGRRTERERGTSARPESREGSGRAVEGRRSRTSSLRSVGTDSRGRTR